MISDELLPCPFCGAVEPTVHIGESAKDVWYPYCDRCEAMSDCNFKTRAEAVAWWNRRAELRQPVALDAEWEDAQHNDIINVNNGLQIRVVIGSGENQGTHLHIRKLQSNGWRHVFLTTLAQGWRLMRPRQEPQQ